ncbi:MAG: carboxypeptidase-like regulatory domain-containing protein, partial [Bacteroidales bacterium]
MNLKPKKRWILIFFLFTGGLASAQSEITISGSVTAKDNRLALPGATVIEVGTSNGTVTNHDGTFTISVEDAGAVLRASFIGYRELSIPVEGR